jgi:hypothetical protein
VIVEPKWRGLYVYRATNDFMSAGALFHVLPSDISEDEEFKALIEWVGAVMWATFGIRYIYNRGHLFCATLAKKL